MKILLLIGALAALSSAASAQGASCSALVDSLDAKVRADYAGFGLEIAGRREAGYRIVLDSARSVAARTAADDCYPVLARVADWFHDPHLFVYQSARVDTTIARRRAESVRSVATSEAAARAYFDRRGGRLDPI